MNNFFKALTVLSFAGVLALGYLTWNDSVDFGAYASRITNPQEFRSTVKIGANGTARDFVARDTCSLVAPSFTVAASTSVAMDCAVTGVVSGDTVEMWFATSSAVFAGWQVVGASASSTSGFITARVFNGTGVSAVIPASLASTSQYEISSK